MEKIAIIGMGCVFPDANSPQEFYDNLLSGKSSIIDMPAEKLGINPEAIYSPVKGMQDKAYYLKGGFIHNFNFNAQGFKSKPGDLLSLDDIYKYCLHASKQALESSGYYNSFDKLSRCGFILGNAIFQTKSSRNMFLPLYFEEIEKHIREISNNTSFTLHRTLPKEDPQTLNALSADFLCSVVTNELGLLGSSFIVDSACSSSLYALKIACDKLRKGEVDMMLAGGVYGNDPMSFAVGFSMLQAFPINGISIPLDKSSEGLTMGEGAGMLVLKRLSDAKTDNDEILAVINNVGLSNDGQGKSFSTPSSNGQTIAFEQAFESSDVKPSDVAYVECHATGTSIGDIAELNAIDSFYCQNGATPKIGSLKANIGHLFGGAAIAGVIKVVMSMKFKAMPPSINITNPIVSEYGNLNQNSIIQEKTHFFTEDTNEIAVVNAFGFGGTNACVILEKPTTGTTSINKKNTTEQSLAISGMSCHWGQCKGIEAFENAIYDYIKQFNVLPEKRWRGIHVTNSDVAPIGCFLSHLEIDALKLKLPVNDFNSLNPQQLLMFNVANEALEDAGFIPNDKRFSRTAIIIASGLELSSHACLAKNYLEVFIPKALQNAGLRLSSEAEQYFVERCKSSILGNLEATHIFSFTGNVIASRIASHWDFNAPAFVVSSGESSVFNAIEIAKDMINSGEVDAVLVGSIELTAGIEDFFIRNVTNKISTNPSSISCDKEFSGITIGEGAGAIVMHSTKDAVKNGSKIYASIDGIHTVKSKKDSSNMLINEEQIKVCCQQALKNSSISSDQIECIEYSNSGNIELDCRELQALADIYKSNGTHSVALGSYKTIIGSLFNAGGMGAIVKNALCLHHSYIPGVHDWKESCSDISLDDTPFYIPTNSAPWISNCNDDKRHLAINNISNDGTITHLIMSSFNKNTTKQIPKTSRENASLFIFSANSKDEFLSQLLQLKDNFDESTPIYERAHTYYKKFQNADSTQYTLCLIARNYNELKREIQYSEQYFLKKFDGTTDFRTPLGSYMTCKKLGNSPISFVYPGAFNSFINMGRDLQHDFPLPFDNASINTELSDLNKLIYPRSSKSLSKDDIELQESNLLSDSTNMMLSGLQLSTIYTNILQEYFSIKPTVACGYSLGEITMLIANGVCEYAEGIKEFKNSSVFTSQLSGKKELVRNIFSISSEIENVWSIYIVSCSNETIKDNLLKYDGVYHTHTNTSGEHIIAGFPDKCKAFLSEFDCEYFEAPFSDVLHCDLVNNVKEDLLKIFRYQITNKSDVTFYTADSYSSMNIDGKSISEHIVNMLSKHVDFERLITQIFKNSGSRIFIEVGPGNTCTTWIDEILAHEDHLAINVNLKGIDDYVSIIKMLSKLISHGVPLDLSKLFDEDSKTENRKKRIIKTIELFKNTIGEVINNEENKELLRTSHYTNQTSEFKEIIAPDSEIESVSKPIIEETIPHQGNKHLPLKTPENKNNSLINSDNSLKKYLLQLGKTQEAFMKYRFELSEIKLKQLEDEMNTLLDTIETN